MSEKNIKIEIDNVEYDYDPETKQSILAFLKEKKVSMDYQCQEGYCGACRCKLDNGTVEENNDALGYKGEGEILPCASKPKSNIKISRLR